MLPIPRQSIGVLAIGACAGILCLSASYMVIHSTGTPAFCMVCHEMRVVGEQGWMRSPHYHNTGGIIAGCGDCHIPPELPHMLWTKARDGAKDIYAHLFGEADPTVMDWTHLREVARRKVSDSACITCHDNLTPKGAPISQIIAHRAYERLDGEKKCTNCHTTEFHGKFREYLTISIDNTGTG